jgi:ABC-type transport system involved in multi-copper enzyme maturation permease subunit
LDVLKSDFYKARRMTNFLILTILAIIFPVFSAVGLRILETGQDITVISFLESFKPPIHIFSSMFTVFFVVEEFKSGRLAAIVSSGVTRVDFFVSKMISSCCFAVFLFAVSTIFAILVGVFSFRFGHVSKSFFTSLFSNFMTIIAWTCFSFTVSFLIRSAGSSLVFMYIFQGGITIFLFSLNAFLNYRFNININLLNFWIFSALEYDLMKGVLIQLVWILLMCSLALWSFIRRDIVSGADRKI